MRFNLRQAAAHLPARVVALGAILLLSLVACAVAFFKGWVRPDTLQRLVTETGSLGMVTYVVGIVLMELLWFPRMWGLLAGGLLFGPWVGCGLSLGGDMVGALACYLLARGGGRAWVAGLLTSRPRAQEVVALIAERRGGAVIAVLRVCPIAHYTLVSYAAGLAGVRPPAFLLGTAVGILPGALLYPVVGDAALRPTSPVFIGSVVILILFLIVTLLAARRILKR